MARDTAELLAAVEEAWYVRTKGELWVEEEQTRSLILALAAEADEVVATTDAVQGDGRGQEIAERPLPTAELARRIATALDVVLYGG